ncbi:hypothetical protein D1155_08040 [Anaerotruncus sp. 80]|uniref:Uncharacterized protein n=1 Tax=Anaerotruncus colihominis TaxID=169435 RepID=A0A845QLM2_9FIRM|nr:MULTISPECIES: hypothetical protein [Anaerotruncus]NBH61597.1 hypothetical protein [Anaerotruncus colihominis]NCF02252.1 hypothetical protein [Anaerotruncus sp. 80]
MDTYQGTCKYCGNMKPIIEESQEAADERVSNECACGGAKLEEVKARLMANINFIARKNEGKALSQLAEEQVKLLKRAASEIVDGNCLKAVFDFGSSKVTIWDAGEKYKVKRTTTREEQAEA